VIALMQMNSEIDISGILGTIRVPTLVMHRRDDIAISVEGGRTLAKHIPDARLIELPGEDHLPYVGENADQIVDEIEEFVTGTRAEYDPDRVLATILFTDIANSTQSASEMGDRAWRTLMERHDGLVRQQLVHYRGREVKTLGDGFLATFDGPARAVRCATAITSAAPGLGLQVRAGLHTGEIELKGDDVGGVAVHTASRIMSLAEPGRVLVSSTVRDLVAGSNLRFEDAGVHTLKGLPEPVRLFSASL
jgi:class 3 adenylate cyclase